MSSADNQPKGFKMTSMKSKTKRLAICAVLCAAALTIFVIEAQIPLPLPIPGIKLGLANIITLFALLYLSPREAFMILSGRILLGAIFVGSPYVLLYSFSGGVVSLLAEFMCLKLFGKRFIVEISVIGAMTHNTVQILCAALVTRTAAVFWYLPPLLIAAVITGAFCGLCVKFMAKNSYIF